MLLSQICAMITVMIANKLPCWVGTEYRLHQDPQAALRVVSRGATDYRLDPDMSELVEITTSSIDGVAREFFSKGRGNHNELFSGRDRFQNM